MPTSAPRSAIPPIGLILSGGHALGAYQAGAYEALHGRGYEPALVSGASIGSINGAIIAGNAPDQRVDRLRDFWEQAALGTVGLAPPGGMLREFYNTAHSVQSMAFGRPGLFAPALPGITTLRPGVVGLLSLYDHRPLAATLERVVDFDRLNRAEVALMVGTVDIETGEPVVFDSRRRRLEPLHFLASTGLLPAYSAVDVDGRCLGDPGLSSNLPIDAMLDPLPAHDLLCFAVDLFDARGERPRSLDASIERAQDVFFATQSLLSLEARRREQRLRNIIGTLADALPKDRRRALSALAAEARDSELTIVLTAYRTPSHDASAKTMDYSRASIAERWSTGRADMSAALDRLEAGDVRDDGHGFRLLDARHLQRQRNGVDDLSPALTDR